MNNEVILTDDFRQNEGPLAYLVKCLPSCPMCEYRIFLNLDEAIFMAERNSDERRLIQIEEVDYYFTLGKNAKEKWQKIPKALYKNGKISADLKFDFSKFGELIELYNGLRHARSSRPATSPLPKDVKSPKPTKRELKQKETGWAVNIVVDLVEKLHEQEGTRVPAYIRNARKVLGLRP